MAVATELLDSCKCENGRSEGRFNLDIHNKSAEVSRLSDISVVQSFPRVISI